MCTLPLVPPVDGGDGGRAECKGREAAPVGSAVRCPLRSPRSPPCAAIAGNQLEGKTGGGDVEITPTLVLRLNYQPSSNCPCFDEDGVLKSFIEDRYKVAKGLPRTSDYMVDEYNMFVLENRTRRRSYELERREQ
eukprot:758496-Hanusia_phi.AAC.6